jgi:crotonobetainyl-CoA:carnitine CoA-transferase CaiB-like acyl-CoA transferase
MTVGDPPRVFGRGGSPVNLARYPTAAGFLPMSADSTPRALIPAFGPLQGVRVIDSGRFVAGPWAATYLGEFGAEIIHVEGPPYSYPFADPTRSLPPILPEGAPPGGGVSESWVQYARNKLSVGLDLRQPAGRGVFLDLIRTADIWIESSRPGTYDRLGLEDATLWSVQPRLTIVHVSGYGQSGDPERLRTPSFDLIGQAFSGFLSLQGEPDPAPPSRSGTALNDTVTGLAAAAAALMGYVSSRRLGRGQSIDVAQYEVFFTLLENLALDYFVRGVVRERHGRGHARLHPYDVHRAKDGWVVVAAPTPETWARLRVMIGLSSKAWDDSAYRLAHREEVDARLAEFCAERTGAELEAQGGEHDVAFARVLNMKDIAQDPHYQARGMFPEWDDPVAGPVKGAGIAPRFSETPGEIWRGAPWLGQDNRRVLKELLGYSEDQIQQFEESRVVGEDRTPRPSAHAPPFFRRAPT